MKIATIRGISIKLHISTLVIVGLVGFSAASFYYSLAPNPTLGDALIVAIISGFLLLFSILVHELMHSLMAQKYGINVPEIELYIFGGVSKIEEEPRNPREEAVISFVGPLSSLILGAIFLLFAFTLANLPSFLFVILFYVGFSNISLALFNLIPAFPMDGGRVLRAILWSRKKDLLRATKTASKIGSLFGYGFMALGIIQIFFVGVLSGFWFILIGNFLSSSAKRSYVQTVYLEKLTRFKAKDILSGAKWAISFDSTIEDAVRDYFIPMRHSYFPVHRNGFLVGIIDLASIKKVPPEDRYRVRVGELMVAIEDFPHVTGEKTAKDVMTKLSAIEERKPHIVVITEEDDDTVMGFIGEEELKYSLRLSRGVEA